MSDILFKKAIKEITKGLTIKKIKYSKPIVINNKETGNLELIKEHWFYKFGPTNDIEDLISDMIDKMNKYCTFYSHIEIVETEQGFWGSCATERNDHLVSAEIRDDDNNIVRYDERGHIIKE